MKIIDLRQKSEQELKDLYVKTKKELGEAVTNVYLKKEKNLKKPGNLRKDIAQSLTMLSEKSFMGGSK
jgi:ribosomal protein L29